MFRAAIVIFLLGMAAFLVSLKLPEYSLAHEEFRWAFAVAWGLYIGLMWMDARHQKQLERMRLSGKCVYCGYDLRATPLRCPECGRNPPMRPMIFASRRLLGGSRVGEVFLYLVPGIAAALATWAIGFLLTSHL